MRLRPTGPKIFLLIPNTVPIAIVPARPPPRLSMKAGPKKVPEKIEPSMTLISVIIIAVLKPNSMSAVRVMIFEIPNLSHGKGLGSIASNPCKARAYADRMAMRYLSCNCLNIFCYSAAHNHNNTVWQADDRAP